MKQIILPENLQRQRQQDLVEDFKCEVEICCRLKHPCLVRASTPRGTVGVSVGPSWLNIACDAR